MSTYRDKLSVILDKPYIYHYEIEEEMEGLQIHITKVTDLEGNDVELSMQDTEDAEWELQCFHDDEGHAANTGIVTTALRRMRESNE